MTEEKLHFLGLGIYLISDTVKIVTLLAENTISCSKSEVNYMTSLISSHHLQHIVHLNLSRVQDCTCA